MMQNYDKIVAERFPGRILGVLHRRSVGINVFFFVFFCVFFVFFFYKLQFLKARTVSVLNLMLDKTHTNR